MNEYVSKTQSICPVCHRPIDAYYMEGDSTDTEDSRVYFVKECPEHGEYRTLAAESSADFKWWIDHPVVNVPPETAITKGAAGDGECPLHCGTCGNHLQTPCCVLIDVTARCNQHCPYCFAQAEDEPDSGEPSLKEMENKLDHLLDLGEEGREFNIQISGGEPTVRDDLPEIIRMASDKGFSYIQINSNGRRLAEEEGYAEALREAGASVIFMQFDGTRDDIYMALRGEPLFETKVRAIRNCERAGLAVTLVPTIVRGINDDNIGEIMDFLTENVNVVKGVHFQPASFFGRYPDGDETDGRITMFGVLRELEKHRPQFRYKDSLPIATGHTLCCCYSTYIKEPDGSIRCTLSKRAREEGIGCCDDGACMTQADRLEVIKKDRDYVLDKWDIAAPDKAGSGGAGGTDFESEYRSSDEITDLDEFLNYYKRNTFTVTGMAFQDLSNLDAERLKRCRVVQYTDDGRLIPFCAYNTIYRKREEKKK